MPRAPSRRTKLDYFSVCINSMPVHVPHDSCAKSTVGLDRKAGRGGTEQHAHKGDESAPHRPRAGLAAHIEHRSSAWVHDESRRPSPQVTPQRGMQRDKGRRRDGESHVGSWLPSRTIHPSHGRKSRPRPAAVPQPPPPFSARRMHMRDHTPRAARKAAESPSTDRPSIMSISSSLKQGRRRHAGAPQAAAPWRPAHAG